MRFVIGLVVVLAIAGFAWLYVDSERQRAEWAEKHGAITGAEMDARTRAPAPAVSRAQPQPSVITSSSRYFIGAFCTSEGNNTDEYDVFSCRHPLFAGAKSRGVDLVDYAVHHFYSCGDPSETSAGKFRVTNFSGDCVDVEKKNARITGFHPRRSKTESSIVWQIYPPPTNGSSWNASSRQYSLNQSAFMESWVTDLGLYGRAVYWIAELPWFLFVSVVGFLTFLVWLGVVVEHGKWRAEPITGAGLLTVAYLLVATWLLDGHLDKYREIESLVSIEIADLNERLRSAYVPGSKDLYPVSGVIVPVYTMPERADAPSGWGFSSLIAWVTMASWNVLFIPFLLWILFTHSRYFLVGVFDLFVPSRNASIYQKDQDKALPEVGVFRNLQIPSVEDILSGSVSSLKAPFIAMSARNQARKSSAISDQLRAQGEQLEAESELYRSAEYREMSRHTRDVRKEDDEG